MVMIYPKNTIKRRGNGDLQGNIVLKPGQKLCKSKELKAIRKKIEILRNEMTLAFVQNGADISHSKVLHLSQLLDEQLNRYDRCLQYGTSNPSVAAKRILYLSMIKRALISGEMVEH